MSLCLPRPRQAVTHGLWSRRLPGKAKKSVIITIELPWDIKEACQETVASCCVGFELALVKQVTSRWSLEDTRAARLGISQRSLTWRGVGFDGPGPEGRGLHRRASIDVSVGLLREAVT